MTCGVPILTVEQVAHELHADAAHVQAIIHEHGVEPAFTVRTAYYDRATLPQIAALLSQAKRHD